MHAVVACVARGRRGPWLAIMDYMNVHAWRPNLPGVTEVFHARIVDHVYPMHTHDSWTLLIVDDGAIQYDLDHHEHGASGNLITLLPPHVPHNGRSAISAGFRKRVLYLDCSQLEEALIGAAIDQPEMRDPILRYRIHQLHQALGRTGPEFEAESRLAMVTERICWHLRRKPTDPPPERASVTARKLRDLLDARICEKFTLQELSGELHVNPAHLVRAFSREFSITPHQYLIGRRVDMARKLLLEGMAPPTVALAVGFYDQAHLTRHFKHVLGTSPGRFARSGDGSGARKQHRRVSRPPLTGRRFAVN
jgi:AraC-like DNA-binding protein